MKNLKLFFRKCLFVARKDLLAARVLIILFFICLIAPSFNKLAGFAAGYALLFIALGPPPQINRYG